MGDLQRSQIPDLDAWEEAFYKMSNPTTREQGYEQLILLSRGQARRFFRLKNWSPDDIEDITSDVIARVWRDRNTRTFPTLPSYLAFLKKSIINACSDRGKSAHQRHTQGVEAPEELTDGHSTAFIHALENLGQLQTLLRVADNLWLGRRGHHFSVQMIAAKLVLWDGRRLSVVLKCVVRLTPTPFPNGVSLDQLLAWITNETILHRLAYKVIHHKPEEVFHAIKRDHPPYSNEELLLIWSRFVHMRPKRGLANSSTNEPEWVEALLDEHEARLPFSPRFERLLQNLRRYAPANRIFEGHGLWKRLVYQYSLYKLPHDDMLQWFRKPAKLANYDLGKNRVHGWIANKRLQEELDNALQAGGWQ